MSGFDPQHLRMVEAILFAATEPLDDESISARLPDGIELAPVIAALQEHYAGRGVNLSRVAGKWALRTAPDLAHVLEREKQVTRRLSRAALETLAIIAYHQPVSRAEIEEVRGVAISKGTLDLLMEAGWVRLKGRRRSPGRPVTYGITEAFLEHFGLDSTADLPGLEELKAAGLLSATVPNEPIPFSPANADIDPDRDPLDADENEGEGEAPLAIDGEESEV